MSGTKWTIVFGISVIFLTVSIFSGVVSQPYLATTMKFAQEGKPFLLSCFADSDLLNVVWIRNVDIIFRTKSDSNDIVDKTEKYKDVSGRITVSTSLRQHNVTLRINSTLDDGSTWQCMSGGSVSDIIYINIIHTIQTTVQSSSTSKATTVASSELSLTNNILTTVTSSTVTGNKAEKASPVTDKSSNQNVTGNTAEKVSPVTDKSSNQNEKLIYIIAASAGGGVVVIVIVVVCVVRVRRKRTQNSPTKNISQDELHPARSSQYDNNDTEMVDNVLYSSGYVDSDYSTVDAYTSSAVSNDEVSDDTKVTDVYTRVQKNKDKTEITVNIEDLYAKPVKKKKKGEPSISMQNNVNISIGQTADENV